MNFATTHRYELSLEPRGLLEIPDAAGVRVTCSRGCLWITLDNDPRDIVLEAGETFLSTEHRRALVYALQASTMALRPEMHGPSVQRKPAIGFMRNAFAS